MKKIINILIFGLVFFSLGKVANAEVTSIRKNEIAQNIVVEVKKGEVVKSIKMGLFVDNENLPIYSLDPFVEIHEEYDVLSSFLSSEFDLSEELYKEIADIMYFGLFFNNRSSHNWYVATQILIWQSVLGDMGQISFAQDVNESLVLTLEEYMNMIKEDILEFHNLVYPSFVDTNDLEQKINCRVNNNIVLVDENNALKDFKLEFDDSFASVITNDNTLNLNFTASGLWKVKLFPKKYIKMGMKTKGYVNNDSLIFLSRGELADIYLLFEAKNNAISFTASDSETGKRVYGGMYEAYKKNSVGGFSFDLNTDNVIIDTIAADYYIREIQTPYGYMPLEEEKQVYLFDKDVDVDFVYEPIKKIVKIEALDDMDLELYKDNQLVDSFTLKAEELKSYKLRYGDYTLIKADKMRKTSTKVEFKIDENYDEEKIIWLEDESLDDEVVLPDEPVQEEQSMVNIQLFDSSTNELISGYALFKIKNKETGKYLSAEEDSIFKMEDGLLTLKDLDVGTYEIEQVEAPFGYRLIKDKALFKINEDSLILNVAIYQNKMSGSMIIKKSDALSLNPIKGVLFAVYDSDRQLLFSGRTNEDGQINLDNLVIGTYYVKEVIDGNLNFDEAAKVVEIKDNIASVVNFFDRIMVSVPKTGVQDSKMPSIIGGGLITFGFILFKKREMV